VGRDIPWLDDRVERFVGLFWNIEVREYPRSSEARHDMRLDGIHDAVRRFLLDVIQRDAVTPEEWGDLCNVQVRTRAEVRDDANHFWEWLFDGEPLPGAGQFRGPLQPPQA